MKIKQQLKTANWKLTLKCVSSVIFFLQPCGKGSAHIISAVPPHLPLDSQLSIASSVSVSCIHLCVCVCLGLVPADGSQKWKCMINDTRFCFLFVTHFLSPLSPFIPPADFFYFSLCFACFFPPFTVVLLLLFHLPRWGCATTATIFILRYNRTGRKL